MKNSLPWSIRIVRRNGKKTIQTILSKANWLASQQCHASIIRERFPVGVTIAGGICFLDLLKSRRITAMKAHVTNDGFKLWLNASDTWNWAHGESERPCSRAAGHSLFVEYDRHGLVDVSIGHRATAMPNDIDNNELIAIVMDFMDHILPHGHFCRAFLGEPRNEVQSNQRSY
jgi:hypothetical protein